MFFFLIIKVCCCCCCFFVFFAFIIYNYPGLFGTCSFTIYMYIGQLKWWEKKLSCWYLIFIGFLLLVLWYSSVSAAKSGHPDKNAYILGSATWLLVYIMGIAHITVSCCQYYELLSMCTITSIHQVFKYIDCHGWELAIPWILAVSASLLPGDTRDWHQARKP